MSEQMRSEFEASGLKSANSVWHEGSYQFKTTDDDGEESFTPGLGLDNIKWQAWQDSRAALCVELPELKDMRFTHPCRSQRLAHNDAVEACRDAIHAAGVKTK